MTTRLRPERGSVALRVPSTRWECGTTCGAIVTVEDGRVTKVGPNREHPASRGAFGAKGIRGLPELTYGASRLLQPYAPHGPARVGRILSDKLR